MPHNSLGTILPRSSNVLFRSFLPEGFAFFTRDPREPQIGLYSADKQEVDLHNGSPRYWFGFDRYPRAFNVELGQILPKIINKGWYDCGTASLECLNNDLLPVYTIQNNFHAPLILGDYYLKISEPTPWAWASSFNKQNKIMPFKVIRVSIVQNDYKRDTIH